MTDKRAGLVENISAKFREMVTMERLRSGPFTWDELASAALDIALAEAAKVAETCPHEDGWYTQGDRRRAEEIASEISRLRGEAESYKRALVFCEDRIANCAGELANLRATNERLGWAVESAAVVFEQVYGNAELAEKVRAAALTATQEKGNGNGGG